MFFTTLFKKVPYSPPYYTTPRDRFTKRYKVNISEKKNRLCCTLIIFYSSLYHDPPYGFIKYIRLVKTYSENTHGNVYWEDINLALKIFRTLFILPFRKTSRKTSKSLPIRVCQSSDHPKKRGRSTDVRRRKHSKHRYGCFLGVQWKVPTAGQKQRFPSCVRLRVFSRAGHA